MGYIIDRIKGRIGTDTEYEGYRIMPGKIEIVAQRGSGEHWYIFEVHPGPKGLVRTLESFLPNQRKEAVKAALAATRALCK